MALVEITHVVRCKPDPEALWGFHLDAPARGQFGDGYVLPISGWVLGKKAPAVAVDLMSRDGRLRRVPLNLPRPDLAKVYPSATCVERSGFRCSLSMLGMPTEFELMASAELEDGTHVPLTEVRGRRTRLQSGFQPRLKPLLLTTMGRTGSTWVTSLLACLPQIVAYRPFQFEPRVASYWMEVLRCLAEPASYMQALAPELYGADWWMGTKRSSPIYQGDVDPDILEVLARDNLEKLAAFCQERIDRFYGQVANRQGQSGAIHFLEKYAPNAVMLRFLWELYPDAREIFLIRDLRDILSSILAFNKIYAQAYFYRERAQNDLEIVREMRNEANTLLKIWRTRSQSAYLLRYEDLIRRPEESLRGVLDYLELDGDPTGIRHTLKQAARTMPEAQQQHRTSQDPLASIGRWRRDLNPALQEACQEAFPELLGAFGYDDD